MKIAVCLSGAIKYPEKSLASIKKIYPNDFIKVFIHTWEIENIKEYGRDSFSGKMGLSGIDVLSEYQYEDILIENYTEKRHIFQDMFDTLQFKESHRKDVGLISMYYTLFKSNQLKISYEIKNNMIFDRVVRMRFDSDFKDKDLILNESPDCIQIPSGNDYAGINDQFAVGPSEDMDHYCNVFNKLEDLKDMEYNPERLLITYFDRNPLKNKGVHRFDFDVAINNG
jgi:hypothetical protein